MSMGLLVLKLYTFLVSFILLTFLLPVTPPPCNIMLPYICSIYVFDIICSTTPHPPVIMHCGGPNTRGGGLKIDRRGGAHICSFLLQRGGGGLYYFHVYIFLCYNLMLKIIFVKTRPLFCFFFQTTTALLSSH